MKYQVITGKLEARTAVHIGSGDGSDTTDALIRRDATGKPIIPGTAIAGALRGLLTRLAPRLSGKVCEALKGGPNPCNCSVCQLFGDVNPSDDTGKSTASRLLVFNAALIADGSTHIRDGVGIDRVTGAAARAGAVKFDIEVLPAGVQFLLRMELRDDGPEDEQPLQLLAAALAEWESGRVWLGGRVARGLGAFKLTEVKYVERDLNQKSQLLAFLRSPEPWKGTDLSTSTAWVVSHLPTKPIPEWKGEPGLAVARRWITFEGTLQAEGPLLTNDTSHAGLSGFEHAPLLVQLGDWSHPVLAGAGLRGVLRSQAERIARTLVTLDNPYQEGKEAENWFLQNCPACDPNARRSPKMPEGELPPSLESCDSLLLYQAGKGGNEWVKSDEVCLACRLFGSTRWGSRLLVEDAPFTGGQPTFKMLDFLAVDRFTGGGAEKLKFDALALWRPAFTMRLHLDNPEPWELGWLALVLRDLADGWLSVGYAAAKGFGRVKLTDWKVDLAYLSADEAPPLDPMPGTEIEGVYTIVKGDSSHPEPWLNLADTWVTEFRAILLGKDGRPGYSRSEKMTLTQDDYFRPTKWVSKLYPKEVKVS